jgi:hypothetical protein
MTAQKRWKERHGGRRKKKRKKRFEVQGKVTKIKS